jgi:hypothetical protein
MLEDLKQIFELINKAEMIYNSTADWEIKYDLIFSEDTKIWKKIRDAGFSFDWYDPDTTYEEDVTAYIYALRKFRESFGDFFERQKEDDSYQET